MSAVIARPKELESIELPEWATKGDASESPEVTGIAPNTWSRIVQRDTPNGCFSLMAAQLWSPDRGTSVQWIDVQSGLATITAEKGARLSAEISACAAELIELADRLKALRQQC